MSFNVNTAQWIAVIFILYTFMVVILPYFVMRRFLAGRRTSHKFLICVIAGNFFYIMIVLIWGLFHITNRYVLIATTAAIPAVMLFKNRKKVWDQYLSKAFMHVIRFFKGENSFHYSVRKFRRWSFSKLKVLIGPLFRTVKKNFIECLIFVACSAAVLYYFSITDHFGPMAADLAVHMEWVNQLDEGNLFGGGVYPFGMHALLYYLHAVFNIPTARIILLFGTVQTFYIFTMLLVFLKEICRFRYTPYIAYISFIAGNYLQSDSYDRYYATLPQEFGMIFFLPSGVALIQFFQTIRQENDEYRRMKEQKLLYTKVQGKRKWKESTLWLWILIISFGLTISAHFYITIIAALLLLFIAAVYIKYLFDWKILRSLILAAIISVMIPVLPMAIAFASGTPLQESLYWALEVMELTGEENENTYSDTDVNSGDEVPIDMYDDVGASMNSTENISQTSQETADPSFWEQITSRINNIQQAVHVFFEELVVTTEQEFQIVFICIIILMIEIFIMLIIREWNLSRYVLIILLYNGSLILLGVAPQTGLPVFISEIDRIAVFLAYTLMIEFSLAIDSALVIGSHLIHIKRFWQAVSFVSLLVFLCSMVGQGHIRAKEEQKSKLQTDGAVVCTFSIMENYPEQKWTIVSCNEERNMVSPVAWHYEVIDFLDSMENYRSTDEMYIPTQYVFFYIEKNVINYALASEFEDVDGRVSEEWASQQLPAKNQLFQYRSYDRIIVNSRMYYWAKEYQKRFPNEMKVYYEDDSFVCYVIEQNEYYLNNFAIDYGYNSGGLQE